MLKSSKTPTKGSRRLPIQRENKQKPKDPVEVYCRVRPLKDEADESCTEVISDTTLLITPPECSLAFKSGHYNATQHIFKHVFNDTTQQKELFDSVACPLIEDLVQGKNGLLFAYGITNSGKTFTVTGEPENPGILPRALDVLFNSIAEVQAQKYVFRPDKTNNTFNVFTEEEARKERLMQRPKKISPRSRAELPNFSDLLRVPDRRKVGHVDEDNSYAVFVSYIEIYNNYVYDLLEEPVYDRGRLHPKPPQSKLLREDAVHNMYVSGATEVEVKSTEEAFELVWQGQRRRRVAETQLNHESSRSHSVFTLRLVQAPLDQTGDEVLQDKSKVASAQLSLVDLAGSERTSRTGSGGDRIREAGNINQSLMVLRTCMETLRDNQLNNANRIVPYRDSKLTHLFKNYFDGEGKVRMVVCVSPRAEDYDETIHVMRFAEVTQEVVVDRPSKVKFDVGLAPGRRRANMLYKAALQEAGDMEEKEPSVSAPHPYQVALGIVCLQQFLSESCSVSSLSELKKLLENRSRVRERLVDDLKKRQGDFRTLLVAQEQELLELRAMAHDYQSVKNSRDRAQREAQRLRGVVNTQERQVTQLSAEVDSLKQTISSHTKDHTRLKNTLTRVTEQKDYLLRTQVMYEHDKRELEQELTAKQRETEREAAEKLLLKKKMKGFVSHEKDKFDRLSKQMQRKQKEIRVKSEKLRQVEELIKNSPLPACSGESVRTPLRDTGLPNTDNAPVLTRAGRKRSLSENWLEHKPLNTVDNGDLLQPIMKKKRTVTNPKPRDLTSRQLDKYCLKHQEQDAEGGVHTELYKGAIMHTRGGGVAVQFTDIEKLNHDSPSKTVVTRSLSQQRMDQDEYNSFSLLDGEDQEEDEWTDVETRCAVGIEGRPGNPPAFSHISTKK